MTRPVSRKVTAANLEVGEQFRTWRKLLRLTLQQVADRAGISVSTLRRIERGDGGVSFQSMLSTARALGILESIVSATDPYETSFGRARADQILPERVHS
ncbi:MAG: helix-turn-helix domain-containing protein [Coriobacteriia bacterium]|nr:helix-turn-helix domain-containing protein [Coriobacteriia bacterium]